MLWKLLFIVLLPNDVALMGWPPSCTFWKVSCGVSLPSVSS